MKALTIDGPEQVRLGEMVFAPSEESVVVAPSYVGLCGTDLELYRGTMPYFRSGHASYPLVPGHEFSGRVVEGAADLPVGTLVVGDPVVGCSECLACRAGPATRCEGRFEIGVRNGLQGAAAELVALPRRNVIEVPPGVTARQAALAEPAVTAIAGVSRVGEVSGKNALVIGDGTLGLISAAILVDRGVDVSVACLDDTRIDLVEAVAATAVVSAFGEVPEESGYDVVFEAAGAPEALRSATAAVAPGGDLVLIGVPPRPVDGFDSAALVVKDATVHGVLNGPGLFDEALKAIGKGLIDAEILIESEYPLDQGEEAFAALGDSRRARPKILISLERNGDNSRD